MKNHRDEQCEQLNAKKILWYFAPVRFRVTDPNRKKLSDLFSESYQKAEVKRGQKMVGGTNGGICHCVYYLPITFHCVTR